MKVITKYKASDGIEYIKEQDCIRHEELIERVNTIMGELIPIPKSDGCAFENGKGFIQQDASVFKRARTNILLEIGKLVNHQWVQETIDDESIDLGYVGRLIDGDDLLPLYRTLYRLKCVDRQYREFGQPYFALHPEKAELILLNP